MSKKENKSSRNKPDFLNNGIKLFEYLEKLSLLNINVRKSVKNLSKDEEKFDLDDKDFLPILDKIFLKNRDPEADKSENLFLSIERCKIEKPPKLPKQLEKWIDFESISFVKPAPREYTVVTEMFEDDKSRNSAFNKLSPDTQKINPILQDWVTKNEFNELEKIESKEKKLFFKDFPELMKLYEDWLEIKWKKWEEKNREYFIANQAYDKFYSLRSFLKTESDNYDLLWGHDIITWKQGNNETYHPTFFTPVVLEFDADRNIISIKYDTNSKSFFDVSFIREAINDTNTNLVDIDALAERINKKIGDGDFDIWDYELIHKYLQKLVHYMSPDGESKYNDRGANIETTLYPTVFNSHHLFLLKKSGKSWADYAKKIQEDIKKNGTLTPFLEDLVCDEYKTEIKATDDIDLETQNVEIDGELYFPLLYNEEQKKIANQVEIGYGSVVQGPPGTGKTHTIANLISRFLALGKTVLITSQTGQALSVLKNMIPKEIRSMAVSQVESDSRGGDLQSSVSEINAMLSDATKFTADRKKRIEKEIQDIREKIAQKNNEFERKALLDSRESIVIGSEKITPINAAKFVEEFQNNNEFKIYDEVSYSEECSVPQAKIDNYISALKSTDSDIWDFVKLNKIPTVDQLPTIDILERYFELKKELTKEELKLFALYIPNEDELKDLCNVEEYISSYESHKNKSDEFKNRLKEVDFFRKNKVSENEFYSTINQDNIFGIYDQLIKIKEKLLSFNKPYEKELFKTARNDNQNKIWNNVLIKIEELIKKYRDFDSILIGKKVEVVDGYEVDYVCALEILSKILKQANDNGGKVKKGVGLLFNPTIKKFLKNVTIDNKSICNQDDIEILKAYFSKKKTEDKLKTIWDQAFQNMENKIDFPNPFNIINFEDNVSCVSRIVYFEKENEKLKKNIENLKLFKEVNLSDDSFVKKALDVFENFISVFKADEFFDLINNVANNLEKENTHKTTLLLSKKLRDKDVDAINELIKEIKELNYRKELSLEFSKLKDEIFNSTVQKIKTNKHNHKSVIGYLQNLEEANLTGIKSFYKDIPDLIDKQNKSEEIRLVEDYLKKKLPKTIDEVKLYIKKSGNIIFDIEKNWKWKRLVSWLNELHSGDTISQISRELHRLKNQEMDLVRDIVQVSAWMHLKKRVTKNQKEALASFALSMKKYGKGTGKYAGKHLSDAKKALEKGKEAVPVWIMPINTIHQLFPDPKSGMFDVVIFDEASQVDTRGLNIAYIGKKLLVVGDDEQVSPTTFTTQSKVTDLITRYIADVPNSHHFSNTSSLFDIAKIKMALSHLNPNDSRIRE